MRKLHKQYKQKRRAKQNRKLEALLTRHKAILRSQYLQDQTLHSKEPGIGNRAEHEIIVSLTTFGKRIHDVYLTIESIMQQSLKPDKIILCISTIEFDAAFIPETLKHQQERGLEILFCAENLGPYKKYHYTLLKYPDSLLVTVDDDLLYPADTIDRLYKSYLQHPNAIHCHRGHKITLNDDGTIKPYKQWDWQIFPTGAGGVLYFPGCFDPEISNQKMFQVLAPNADDVWLKAMSLKKGTPCKIVEGSRDFMTNFLTIESSQDVSLKRRNKAASLGNDDKIKAVLSHYGLESKLSGNP